MTKEDVIEILERFVLGAKPCSQKEIVDACVSAYRMLKEQPSLPSDLDEVVIPESEMVEWMKYGPHTNYPWCGIPDAIKITAEHFFALGKQAGAEWMAGQFQKIEGDLVDWYSTSDGKDYCCGVKTIDAFEAPEGFYIRKK